LRRLVLLAAVRHVARTVRFTSLPRGVVALACGVWLAAIGACGLDLQGLGELAADAGTVDGTLPESSMSVEGAVQVEASQSDGTSQDALEQDVAEAGELDSPVQESSAEAQADAAGDAGGADACDAAVEDCTNGVDDNCDGLIDCADPECASQGFACTPAVPPGWSLVAYVGDARPACPTGWGASAPLVEGPDGGGVCQCACGTPTVNPCEQGTLSMSLGQNVCGCSQVQNVPLVSNGLCDPIGHGIGTPCGPWGDGKVAALGPAAVACSETRSLPAISYAAQGEVCSATESAGAGCSAGGGCLPETSPATACIEQAGVQTACPPGFTQLHVVYAPGSIFDGRRCADCGCTPSATACNNPSLTLYDDDACSKNGVTIPVDGNCDDISGNPSDAGWFLYTATPNSSACSGASTTGIDGGLSLNNPKTICCP